MKSKTLHLIILIFSAVYTISCHDDDPAPLRFYDNYYEVPMGGKRHLGIESGNGNYSVEIADTRIATAGVEYGWTGVPNGCTIYVEGSLTGNTVLKVTDYATMESCNIDIKVVDNYEKLTLIPNKESQDLFTGISDFFLVNNPNREVYFFKKGKSITEQELELVTKGTYRLEKEEGNNEKAILTLTYAEAEGAPATDHAFILWGTEYIFHRLNKNLNLNWNTKPIASNRTSPQTIRPYLLEKIEEGVAPGSGKKMGFTFNGGEMPFGILGH